MRGSAAGLFLTTAQSSIALGVAAIGGVFFSRLGPTPSAASYLVALSSALSCNLILLIATFLLVLLLPRAGRILSRPQDRARLSFQREHAAVDDDDCPVDVRGGRQDKAERHVGHLLGITVAPKRHAPSGDLVLASSGILAVIPV